jgi:hypothetical protein
MNAQRSAAWPPTPAPARSYCSASRPLTAAARVWPGSTTPGLFVDFGIYYVQAKHVVAGELALHEHWVYPALAAALVAGFGLLELQPARLLWGSCRRWLAPA